jgi:DNA-binding SARP family transcriptional activator
VLDFGILGPLRVTASGVPVAVSGRRQQQILAALLVSADRLVTPDGLVDCLWPVAPPATARAQVRNCAAGLRRTLVAVGLPPAALSRTHAGYVLRVEPWQVDAWGFEKRVRVARDCRAAGNVAGQVAALRAAEALWRGPALAGLTDGPLVAEAMRLEEWRVQVVEDRVDAELALGRHQRLLPELQVLGHRYPERDRIQAALLTALQRSGCPAESLAVYDRLSAVLAAEFGCEPSPALRRIREGILSR